MANGSADDLATNVLLASNKIKIIAPAMNTVMWSNKIVKKNIKNLKKLGTHILEPQTGKIIFISLEFSEQKDQEN